MIHFWRQKTVYAQLQISFLTPLSKEFWVLQHTQVFYIQLLLESGLSTEYDTFAGTLLERAVRQEKLGLVKLLVKYSVDLKRQNCMAVGIATYNSMYDILLYLISVGADVNAEQNVHWAILNEDIPVISLLISAGATPPENWDDLTRDHMSSRDNTSIRNALFPGKQNKRKESQRP